jgi:hypothetical protein
MGMHIPLVGFKLFNDLEIRVCSEMKVMHFYSCWSLSIKVKVFTLDS